MEIKYQKAIILLSGGMDSLVTAAIAKEEAEELYFLHCNYGQLTEKREQESFEAICQYYKPKESKILNWDWFKEIGGSALTDSSLSVPKQEPSKDIPIPMFLSAMPIYFVLQYPGQRSLVQKRSILEQ
jgi:7-cyano-7-deazaguanine synthase